MIYIYFYNEKCMCKRKVGKNQLFCFTFKSFFFSENNCYKRTSFSTVKYYSKYEEIVKTVHLKKCFATSKKLLEVLKRWFCLPFLKKYECFYCRCLDQWIIENLPLTIVNERAINWIYKVLRGFFSFMIVQK